VTSVGLFGGSPFDGHLILSAADFKVAQIGGSNEYEFNCEDLIAARSSAPRQFQTSQLSIKLHRSKPSSNHVCLNRKRNPEKKVKFLEVLVRCSSMLTSV